MMDVGGVNLFLDVLGEILQIFDETRVRQRLERFSHSLFVFIWFGTLLVINRGGLLEVGPTLKFLVENGVGVLQEWELNHDFLGVDVHFDGFFDDALLECLGDGDVPLLCALDAFLAFCTSGAAVGDHRVKVGFFTT